MKEHTCIDNYINGNLSDAKRQAKRIPFENLLRTLEDDYGKEREEAFAVAYYLKHPSQETFDAACRASVTKK